MDVKLYERTANGLVINAAGRALRADVGGLLARAVELRSRCISANEPDRLRLGVSAALGDTWLMRRLPGSAARHPSISVEVSTFQKRGGYDLPLIFSSAWS